jgi:hypothetical protein
MFRVSIITRASTKALNCDCAKVNTFAICARELIEDKPMLTAVTEPMLNAPKAIEEQISGLGRKVVHLARNDSGALHEDTRHWSNHCTLLSGDHQ